MALGTEICSLSKAMQQHSHISLSRVGECRGPMSLQHGLSRGHIDPAKKGQRAALEGKKWQPAAHLEPQHTLSWLQCLLVPDEAQS